MSLPFFSVFFFTFALALLPYLYFGGHIGHDGYEQRLLVLRAQHRHLPVDIDVEIGRSTASSPGVGSGGAVAETILVVAER